MYCLPSFSPAATVFTAFTAAFYTVEPRSYQQRDKSLQCHVILSSSHKSIISLLNWFGNSLECCLACADQLFGQCVGNLSMVCIHTLLAKLWQPGNSRERWKVSRKGRMKVSHLEAALSHEAGLQPPPVIGEEFAASRLEFNSTDNLLEFLFTHTPKNFKSIEIGWDFGRKEICWLNVF